MPKPARFPSFQTIKKINLFNPAQKLFQKICAAVSASLRRKDHSFFHRSFLKSSYRLGAKILMPIKAELRNERR